MVLRRDGTIFRDGGKSMRAAEKNGRKRRGFGVGFNEYLKQQGKTPLQTDMIDKLNAIGESVAKDFQKNKDKYVFEGQCVMAWFTSVLSTKHSKEERRRIFKIGPYNYAKEQGADVSKLTPADVQRMCKSAFAAVKGALEKQKTIDTVSIENPDE